MNRALALVLLAASTAAGAQCTRLEFAELESLTPDQLLRMRCDYQIAMYQAIDSASQASKSSTLAANAVLARGNACAVEIGRMDRILARTLNIPGDEGAVIKELGYRCQALAPPK